MSLPDFITMAPVQRIDSPCVNVCRIGRDRLCLGCRRSVDEITRWSSMSAAERDGVMADLPSR